MDAREVIDQLRVTLVGIRGEAGGEGGNGGGGEGDCGSGETDAACDMMRRLLLLADGSSDGLQKMIERGCTAANQVMLDGTGDTATRARADGVLQSLYYLNQALRTAMVSHRVLRATLTVGGDDVQLPDVRDDELTAGIARFTRMDTEDANRTQQLLLYLLNCLQSQDYRRSNGECYKRVRSPDGHDTHAWEHACSIRDFVYESTRKEMCYEHWLNLTSLRTNMSAVVEHLSSCRDVQFPDLTRDRHVFSFRDGIYLAASDEFVAYGSAAAAALPAELSATKYSDLPFAAPEHVERCPDDWYDTPTPRLQSIMDYQEMPQEVCRWLYVMIGRLLYDLNELDTWQVIPFLKGAASSGKSTILVRVCRGMYDAADVGVLSNNVERKFGLSALHDKLLFIAPEVKSDLGLEQASTSF